MSAVELAADLLREALRPHFKGKTAGLRLEEATNDALNAVAHLITVREDVKKGRLGATVMTQGASMAKRPGSVPRSL